jgi:hypothetical protein
MANGAPLGVFEYKYGFRVWVIALRSPPQWLTPEGLKVGGPRAFGYVFFFYIEMKLMSRFRIDMDYNGVSTGAYEPPKSVWEMFGESPKAL